MASSRYIYEMVTFERFGEDDERGFYVAHHFEDYFTSRKAAVDFCNGYILWLLKEKMANEAIEHRWENKFHSQCVLWRVYNEKEIEYYGIVRHMILN